ncbi:response regulator [Rheinheimera texasensis]|uniref:response regulator n=1 Tax=Rheinheimera texasensis TaxID=306205 RepID=UPI0004E1F8FD|nr:response regulator [Rheinheimera texasensis]
MKTLKPGEIAAYCDVHHRTVSRWIANGQLKGHKLPGRGNYRVLLDDFIRFLQQQQMPMPQDLIDTSQSVQTPVPHAMLSARILVIDDEMAYRNAIRRVLFGAGYQLDFAADGFQAGVKISTGKPDLVTLDLSMPGLDGFEVLSFIRQQPELAAVRILVISGLGPDELAKARALGADATLPKPFDNEQLLQLVQQLLRTGADNAE